MQVEKKYQSKVVKNMSKTLAVAIFRSKLLTTPISANRKSQNPVIHTVYTGLADCISVKKGGVESATKQKFV